MGRIEGTDAQGREAKRILDEYSRREQDIPSERYAVWQPAELFLRQGRARVAVRLLRQLGVFPVAGDPCVEVGFGRLGWLADLLGWGLRCEDIYGIELDQRRAVLAQRALPNAELKVGNASRMPWPDCGFHLAITSTVFTSILDQQVRQGIANEIVRVLHPGGALLWYDFRVNNPANQNVRGVSRREIRELFPQLSFSAKSVTLAPPIARRIVPVSWTLATLLEGLPFLRSHLVAVMVKPDVGGKGRAAHA